MLEIQDPETRLRSCFPVAGVGRLIVLHTNTIMFRKMSPRFMISTGSTVTIDSSKLQKDRGDIYSLDVPKLGSRLKN